MPVIPSHLDDLSDTELMECYVEFMAWLSYAKAELVNSANTVFDAIKTNKFKVKIFKKFALKDAVTAHEELEARKLTGPSILVP